MRTLGLAAAALTLAGPAFGQGYFGGGGYFSGGGGYFANPMRYFGNPSNYMGGALGFSVGAYTAAANWWGPPAGYTTPFVDLNGALTQWALQNGFVPAPPVDAAAAAAAAQDAANGIDASPGLTPATGSGALGVTSAPAAPAYVPAVVPRTSDSIDARFEANGNVRLRWKGDAQQAAGVVFSLLDKNGKTLVQKTVTRLPVEAVFTMTNMTAYYQVVVTYLNGAKTTVISPL